MPTPPSPDRLPADPSAVSEIVTARIRMQDLTRLDHAAARRGITREDMVAEAIDGFLAREMWSGGFVTPPPMEIPRPARWRLRPVRRRRPAGDPTAEPVEGPE